MNKISNSSATDFVWTKSSYSGGSNNCLEVAHGLSAVLPVRDSKVPAGPALVFADTAWGRFINAVKNGDLSL
ncbi:DUF397 domain-containing protein [Streptomyces sp. NPDC006355]|uniref:DUF397 domain-containing protein n=1 Tax=Streptomyces sp. NPDC006355 TaxID=3156758 RepID=UPI0033BD24DB